MLHVIQVVMWGVAEQPRAFLDAGNARAAYVDCTTTRWGQRYAAYCEHHGVPAEAFTSAQAFLQTIDVSEKCTVHYWTLATDETCAEARQPDAGEMRQMAAGLDAVRDGLARLLADVTQLADRCPRTDSAPAAVENNDGIETMDAAPATEETAAVTEASPETRVTAEWQNFVALIQRSFSNSRNQATLLPRDDWRQDVYSHLTALEYWDWVADRTKRYRNKAEQAGYAVVAEEGVLGSYQFANREGIGSDDHYGSEWEAWCAAGLHLQTGGNTA